MPTRAVSTARTTKDAYVIRSVQCVRTYVELMYIYIQVLTNIERARYQTERHAWLEPEFLHQERLEHVEHGHGVDLH